MTYSVHVVRRHWKSFVLVLDCVIHFEDEDDENEDESEIFVSFPAI